MELILLRHPETTYNASSNRYCGRTDAPLSAEGLKQVEALRTHLARVELTAVWSSPLRRARRCAEAIAAEHGLAVQLSDAFVEFDFGAWEGLRTDEIRERYPDHWQRWNASHPDAVPPGGEHPLDVYRRVVRGLNDLATQYPEGTVLLVTHDQVIRMAFTFFLGLPYYRWRELGQPANGSLCRVDCDVRRGRWRMVAYNHTVL